MSKIDYNRYVNEISKSRGPSKLRESTAYVVSGPPTLISLGGGIPNPTTFPYKAITVEAKDGSKFTIEGKELSRALQYSETTGIAELKSWLMSIHKKYHNPPIVEHDDFEICVTAGCQDAVSKVLTILTSAGDNILVEDPVYTGTISVLEPLPVNIVSVATDEFGLNPESLSKALSKWDPKDATNPKSDIPKVLYTVPNCGNPTGASTTIERKKKIYEIAQRYNLVIVEDDPYYLLQYQKDKGQSYQSLDVDGRVVRCDSMSKIMAAGFRIGWVSGAKSFMKIFNYEQQANVMHCSTTTQVLAAKLLDIWKMDGFEKHLESINEFYKSQRDHAIASVTRWLTGLAEWSVPQGGMFLWLRILNVSDTREIILKRAFAKEVVLIPGSWFTFDDKPSPYCRISFSAISAEEIDEVSRCIIRARDSTREIVDFDRHWQSVSEGDVPTILDYAASKTLKLTSASSMSGAHDGDSAGGYLTPVRLCSSDCIRTIRLRNSQLHIFKRLTSR